MSKNEIIDLDLKFENADETEEKEMIENRKEKKKGKITYQKVKGKDGQFVKGLRIKLVDGKKWGYEATFCIGYKDVYDEKSKMIVHKQVKERKSFSNREKAENWLKEMGLRKSKLAEKNQLIEKHGYTVAEVCELFKQDKIKHGATRGQIQDLNNRINHYKAFFVREDNKYVKKIDTAQIQEYLDFEKDLGRCDKSIQKYKSSLYQMWEFMLQARAVYQVDYNVVKPAKNYAGSSGKGGISLTYNELKELIKELCKEEDPSYLFLCVFGSIEGLRRGEMCGLKYGDIDFDNKTILIQHNRVQRVRSNKEGEQDTDEENVKLPKREKIRIIEIPKAGMEMLEIYKEWQEEKLGRPVEDDDYVLMFEINLKYGYIPSTGKISRKWKEEYTKINKRREKEGLEPIKKSRLHDGRHTYATLTLSGVKKEDGTIIKAASSRQVYESMGHDLPEFMQNITEEVYKEDTINRWDITRFWDELIDFSIKEEWEKSQKKRIEEFESLTVDKQEKIKYNKQKRMEKAYKEKLAGNPPEEDIIEYEKSNNA